MVSFRKLSQKSIFWRLFFGFIVVAVPLFVISSATIWYSSNFVTDKVQHATKMKMQFFISSLEKELENISQMLVALNNDPDLPTLYLMHSRSFDFDNVKLYGDLRTKMNMIYYSSEYIADVFVLFPETNEQFSLQSGFLSIGSDRMAALEQYVDSRNVLDRYTHNDILTYIIGFSVVQPKTNVQYLLGVDIYQTHILKSLGEYGIHDEFSAFLYENESGRLIDERSLTETDKRIHEAVVREGITDGSLRVGEQTYFVQRDISHDGIFSLVSYAERSEILDTIYFFNRIAYFLFLFAICSFLLFSAFVYRQIRRPLRRLMEAMRAVEIGNYHVQLNRHATDEFSYVFRQYNRMAEQVKTLVEEVLENKIQLKSAQLKQLQSQINPHFLFNSLYIGYRMAKSGDLDNTAKLCKYLGDYFRYVTRHAQEEIRIGDEISFARTYLDIQKLRFSNKFDYEIKLDEGTEDYLIPALSIQPLVENAWIHGIEKQDAVGSIRIRVERSETELVVSVEDSGAGMTLDELQSLRARLRQPEHRSDHSGLWNVHWRLKHQFKDSCDGLRIDNREAGGLILSFHMVIGEGTRHVSLAHTR